jgi:hypothetical protein
MLTITINGYEEQDDAFELKLACGNTGANFVRTLPAILLPALVGEFGEPSEFIGRSFSVTAHELI